MKIPWLDIHRLLRVLRIFGNITCTWPPKQSASSRELFLRDVMWGMAVLNVISLMIPLLLKVVHYENNIISPMKALSELTALIDVLLNLILCRMGRLRLQNILKQIESFVESATEQEMSILRKYMDRYLGFYVLVVLSYIATAIAFVCGPMLLSSNLPAEGWYPFSIEPPVRRFILYITQLVAILQTGLNITVDFWIAMFVWYSSARLDILGLELKNARHERDLNSCIRKHQEIIRFVQHVEVAVQNIIGKTNITMACVTICGGFPLVYKQPPAVTAQFICMVMCGMTKLYITAWPADDLNKISRKIALSAYSTKWIEKPEFSRNIHFIIQRSQKPLVIRMSGILPALSLEYCGNFVKTTSSYFMAMRAIVDN